MPADGAARVRFLFHCWLLLIAAAALCDEAAAQGSACGKLDPGQVDPIPHAEVRSPRVNFVTLDWLPPDSDTNYYYIVSCPTCPTKQANTTDETSTFSNLTAATEYSFTIQAGLMNCSLSNPFYLAGKTALSVIRGQVYTWEATETSFRAYWPVSPDAGVQYEVSCAGLVQKPHAVCFGQESGTKIEVTVRPVKPGFPPGNYLYGTALTKLTAINASSVKINSSETTITMSWKPSSTAGVAYLPTCRRVSYVPTVTSSSVSVTWYLLQSGQAYNMSIGLSKAGGFDDVVTQLPIQWTKDGEAGAVAELRYLSVPGSAVRLSWQPLSPLVGQGVVFEYALRLEGPDGCAAALQLNCSDCGRHRQQLQSDEARQRLEDLTKNCAAPVSVRAFSFYDTELVLEVPVSSPNSLQPWTEYSASLWPVNLAGPGAVCSISFRSPETPSGAVRSLRATPSEAEALVVFEEPELANGLLQAFAVQLFTSASVCPQILVLNSTSAPGCQLPKCSTEQLLKKLTDECNSASTAAPIVSMRYSALSNSGNGSYLTVRVQQLQPGTEYSVRVTPVSQTLPGASAELKFITAGGGGGGNVVTIVVTVVVSVLVVFSICAAVVVFVRRHQQNSAPQQTAPTSSAADNRASEYKYDTVAAAATKPTDYVEIVPVTGDVRPPQQTAPASSSADNRAKDAFNDYATVAAATADPTDYVKIVPVKGQVRYKC